MRAMRWLVIPLALALGSGAAASQNVESMKREVAKLEEDWITAVIKRDAAAFNRLLTANFVYTEDDRVYSKAQLIKEVTTGSDTVTAGRNEDLLVDQFRMMSAVQRAFFAHCGFSASMAGRNTASYHTA